MKQKLMFILLLATLTVIFSSCKQKNQVSSGDAKPTPAVGVVSEAPTSTPMISPIPSKEDEN